MFDEYDSLGSSLGLVIVLLICKITFKRCLCCFKENSSNQYDDNFRNFHIVERSIEVIFQRCCCNIIWLHWWQIFRLLIETGKYWVFVWLLGSWVVGFWHGYSWKFLERNFMLSSMQCVHEERCRLLGNYWVKDGAINYFDGEN